MRRLQEPGTFRGKIAQIKATLAFARQRRTVHAVVSQLPKIEVDVGLAQKVIVVEDQLRFLTNGITDLRTVKFGSIRQVPQNAKCLGHPREAWTIW